LMSNSPTWDWGYLTTCDPGITVYVSGTPLDPFDFNALLIYPVDHLEVIGPPDKFARFATWIDDPDLGAPEIANTDAFPLAGGTSGLAGELIPLVGPSWP
jgi:hypothetical protein